MDIDIDIDILNKSVKPWTRHFDKFSRSSKIYFSVKCFRHGFCTIFYCNCQKNNFKHLSKKLFRNLLDLNLLLS